MRRLWSRYHRIVWGVLVVKALFGLSYTLLLPTYRGPDEAKHVDMVIWYGSNAGYPDPTGAPLMAPEVEASERLMGPFRRLLRPPQQVRDAVPRPDRPRFEELEPLDEPRHYNHMAQHPPLFYSLTAASSSVSDLIPDTVWSWDRQVHSYRLLTWLSTLGLPLLAAEVALALGLGRASTAVAAAVTLLVPGFTFIGAVVNNDGLAVMFASLAIVGSLAYLRHGGMRWAVVTAIGCAGAPLTKSTVAPTVVWAVGVVVVGIVRSSGWRPSLAALRHLAVVGLGALVGFAWHLTSLLRFADPQPNAWNRPNRDISGSLVDYGWIWTRRVASSFWGQPARRAGVTLAPWMIALLTTTVVVLCVLAFVRARRHRWPCGLLGLLIVGQVGLMFRVNWRAFQRDGHMSGLQGRYLYALILPMAALVAVAVASWSKKRARRHVIPVARGLFVAGAALHLFLGWSMLRSAYWDPGGEGAAGQLRAVLAWSPLPVALTLGTFATTGMAMAIAGWVAFRADAPALAGREPPLGRGEGRAHPQLEV